ncbi:hypothetical protein [Streptomyces sp. S.PB5]|uniref:hypothetical protein n=1 Tax=Streptomyces sp. S.PB5 TaxID=3020844 RepID=UPI0025AEE389|nr:hypothetical protein [Streptomyces sp. S.PB5]MDN3026048.1 hypothetical protein [Streptomyces sp. S.PB5]
MYGTIVGGGGTTGGAGVTGTLAQTGFNTLALIVGCATLISAGLSLWKLIPRRSN